jgi:hypothetical protein
MAKDFLPSKNAELLAWATAFGQKITATPTAFGLVAAQATGFNSLLATFSAALAEATDPATRTRGKIQALNAARTPLKAQARALARIINAFPAITNEQRVDLGLNPRTGIINHSEAPEECPVLEVVGANGRILKVRLHAVDSNRRGRPEGVESATVMSFVGSAIPADISQWKFEGSTTRTTFDVEFPATVPAGSQVWLTAFWSSPRAQSGPACQPVAAYLAGGVTGSLAQAA